MLAPAAAVFSLLLIITGIAKIARPRDVERALAQMGMPRVRGTGLVLGFLEVVVGVSALVFQGVLIIQAVLFTGFAIWVLLALRSNVPLASCGCLGREDTPPTSAHVVLNVVGALVSSGAAFGAPLHIGSGLESVALAVTVAVGVFLGYIVLTDLAAVAGAKHR
ncbi:MAG TPA: MauE/DoxX family redox-associated membrane protein [Acidimicrobiia bacterium]|nr:MauE/DoxX family redox-associated membrane protein [Acidimicrobiia bacterium]